MSDDNEADAVEKARRTTPKTDPQLDATINKAVQNGLTDSIKRKTPPLGEA